MPPMLRPGLIALSLLLVAPQCKRDEDEVKAPQTKRPEREPIEPTAEALAIVAAEDRTEKDRETDARRYPAELLTFLDLKPGMKVADLAAGSGYSTELLVRAVGESGTVYAQNNAETIDKFVTESWPQRLARPVNHNVVRVDREYDDPFPPGVEGLDLVTILFSYHDVIAQGHDVGALNARVFEVLRPGGAYVVLDHAAPAGSGLSKLEELHRIDEKTVIEQVTAAGFELVETSNFLRDPTDTLDTKVWDVGFETDRFALKFVKPGG